MVFQIIPILFSVIAAWMLGREILSLRRSKQSESWPFTEGEVISSQVKGRRDTEWSSFHSAEVRYQYMVDDTASYVSDTISFGSKLYLGRPSAEEVVAMYPVGAKVTVYYDPHKPQLATLETGISVGNFIVLGLSAMFLLIGLGILFSQ
jgi:hypothetical protein